MSSCIPEAHQTCSECGANTDHRPTGRVCCRGANESGDSEWRAPNGSASPELLESGEVEWGAMPNLDLFFERVYRCAASSLHQSRAEVAQREDFGQTAVLDVHSRAVTRCSRSPCLLLACA